MRKISKSFMSSLKEENGNLSKLLQYVKEDDTLDLELRGNYISIYYRGAPLMTVEETEAKDKSGKNIYKWHSLNSQYNDSNIPMPTPSIDKIELYFPICKHIIDKHIVCAKKNIVAEREIEQYIIKENNYSPNSNDTDFFIADMEYKDTEGEFDLVAIKWEASPLARKSNCVSVAVIEVKQGFKSVLTTEKTPGLKQHQSDFNKLYINEERKKKFMDEIVTVFKQKCELGLIKANEKIERLTEESNLRIVGDLEFYCLLANYKTESDNLKNELEKMDDCEFFTSSYMGYGLYSKRIVNKKDILEHYDKI